MEDANAGEEHLSLRSPNNRWRDLLGPAPASFDQSNPAGRLRYAPVDEGQTRWTTTAPSPRFTEPRQPEPGNPTTSIVGAVNG